MPGLGGRMSTVVKAKISKLLDRAEDPAETLDYGYNKQLELLQNVKKGIADVVTAKKRIQMQAQKHEQSIVKLDTQARTALAQGREDLARTALERKAGLQAELQVARSAGRRARGSAGEADREREEDADEDRGVPHQEGSHQGAVLGVRGAGADLRGGFRRRRADGRPRPRDAARRAEDRGHARACVRGRGARGCRCVRRHHVARWRRQDEIDRELAALSSGAQVDDELAKMKAELGPAPAEAEKPALGQGESA